MAAGFRERSRWQPGSGEDVIEIDFQLFDGEEFLGFPVTCFVVDDGAFELPADAAAEVDRLSDGLVVRYSRTRYRLELDGETSFFVRSEVAE